MTAGTVRVTNARQEYADDHEQEWMRWEAAGITWDELWTAGLQLGEPKFDYKSGKQSWERLLSGEGLAYLPTMKWITAAGRHYTTTATQPLQPAVVFDTEVPELIRQLAAWLLNVAAWVEGRSS